ncbi:MAG: leucine-rich repeat domain-containing protein, partial [Clostridia bacterium]|nr:leucine-rich repeat domain-containing protein [Clostridia bacterium]
NQWSPPAGTTQYATYDTTPKSTEGADKLWLMSVAEVYTLLGGGTIGADGTIASSWSTEVRAGCNWDADNTSDYYWLRSPNPRYSDRAFGVLSSGGCGYYGVGSTCAVRPAFNLELGGGNTEEDTPVNAEDVPYLAFTVINENEKSVEVSLDRSASVPSDLVIPSHVIMNEKQYTVTSIPDADYDSGQALQGVSCNSLTLPNSLKYIGSFAFYAASINNLYIGSGIEHIAAGSYINHAVKNYNTYENGKYLGSETHPYIVLVSIDSSTIVSAKIHDDCKIIFSYPVGGVQGVFQGCSSLKEVVLPNNLSQIGINAFYGCTSLTSITIPDSVTSIGDSAFYGCTNLIEVNVKATSVPIGSGDISGYGNMFDGCSSSLKIYVPTASVSAYQTAEYWSNYSSQIQGKDF